MKRGNNRIYHRSRKGIYRGEKNRGWNLESNTTTEGKETSSKITAQAGCKNHSLTMHSGRGAYFGQPVRLPGKTMVLGS
jgi:hypothetical protein